MKKKTLAQYAFVFLAATEIVGTVFPYRPWLDPINHLFHLAGGYTFFVPSRALWTGRIRFLTVTKTTSAGESHEFFSSEFSPMGEAHLFLSAPWMDPELIPPTELQARAQRILTVLKERHPDAQRIGLQLYEMQMPAVGQAGVISFSPIRSWTAN